MRDLFGWTGDVFDAKKENKQLKADLASCAASSPQSQTAERDAQQLRAMVGLGRSEGFPQGTNPVTARVIAPFADRLVLERSRSTRDRATASRWTSRWSPGDGLVGKVTSVAGGTARVTLITDASSAVSAQIVPDGASGIVKPAIGDPDDLLLDFIQKGKRVSEGPDRGHLRLPLGQARVALPARDPDRRA